MIIEDIYAQNIEQYQHDEVREINGKTITKTVLRPPNAEDRLAFILDGVFTLEECENWIN